MGSPVVTRGLSYVLPDGRPLFTHLNLSFPNGITALVGPNGIGKTTLSHLLAGTLAPTSGTIHRAAAVSYMAQRLEPPAATVDEYLIAHDYWDPLHDGDRSLRDALIADIDGCTSCNRLSGGEWMRVRLALQPAHGFLILDEPTNDLDLEARKALARFLIGRRGDTVLISHDRAVLALCAHVLELSNRGVRWYRGGWEAYGQAREAERAGLERALERAEQARKASAAHGRAQRERQEGRARQGARDAARGGQAKILLGLKKRKAEATTGRIDAESRARADAAVALAREALEALKIDPVLYARLRGHALPDDKLVAEAVDFNLRHAGAAGWLYPEDLAFTWRGNARIHLRGGNGSGKSSLLRALCANPTAGLPPQDHPIAAKPKQRGRLRVGGLTTILLDQTCSWLDPDDTVCGNMRRLTGLPDQEIRNRLAGFLFSGDTVFQRVSTLSGGERLRATLAAGMLGEEAPELLLLDEPTNNLDLPNIRMLETLVANFNGAVVLVSHDEAFVEACGMTTHLDCGTGR